MHVCQHRFLGGSVKQDEIHQNLMLQLKQVCGHYNGHHNFFTFVWFIVFFIFNYFYSRCEQDQPKIMLLETV